MSSNTLAELAADPSRVTDVDRDDVPDLLSDLEALRARLWSRLVRPPAPSPNGAPAEADLISATEVGRMLDMSADRVYALAREDRIPHVRIGRSVKFSRQAVAAWIEDGGTDSDG